MSHLPGAKTGLSFTYIHTHLCISIRYHRPSRNWGSGQDADAGHRIIITEQYLGSVYECEPNFVSLTLASLSPQSKTAGKSGGRVNNGKGEADI